MSWYFIVINLFGILLEAILISYIFRSISIRKYPWYIILSGYILFFIIQSIMAIFIHVPYLMEFVILTMIFLISLIYDMKWLRRLIASIILTLVFILTEMFVGLTVSSISGTSIEEHQSNPYFYFQCVIGSKIFVLILAQVFKIFATKTSAKLSNGMYAAMILFPLATCFIVFATTKLMYTNKDSQLAILIAIGIIGMIISNFILIYFSEKNIKQVKDESERQILLENLKQKTIYYEDMIDKYKISNKKMHDIDNQMLILRSMITTENINSLSEFEKVDNVLKEVKNTIFTGNPSIDAILNNITEKSNAFNISFNSHIFISNLEFVSEMDFCILLGNLLDNAVEECIRKISEEKQETFIDLEIKQYDNYIQITVENSKRNYNIASNRSSKTNPYIHGYGLQIIQDIATKYNGNFTIETNKETFIAYVLINAVKDKISA